MLIFIDESGDPGFKISRGSSKVFVLVLVIFDTNTEAQNTEKRIIAFKTKMWKTAEREIKFTKLNDSNRLKFLENIRSCNFRIRAMVVMKERMKQSMIDKYPKLQYRYFLKEIIEHNKDILRNANIRLDGEGERDFRRTITTYLRKNLRENIITNFKFVDSEKDSLIQLADVVAGCVHRKYQGTDKYSKVIEKKIEEIWEFV